MRIRSVLLAVVLGVSAMSPVFAQHAAKPSTPDVHRSHVVATPADLQWGPAPPVLPAGVQVAVLDGDPFKPGFFSIRLKLPDGCKIAPHWHPTDESIVVVQGTFKIGSGDTFDESATRALTAGSFTKLPKRMHHYAGAKGETIVQVYGPGPFVINYLNPNDDPSRKSTP